MRVRSSSGALSGSSNLPWPSSSAAVREEGLLEDEEEDEGDDDVLREDEEVRVACRRHRRGLGVLK